jgi:hypothetical protein
MTITDPSEMLDVPVDCTGGGTAVRVRQATESVVMFGAADDSTFSVPGGSSSSPPCPTGERSSWPRGRQLGAKSSFRLSALMDGEKKYSPSVVVTHCLESLTGSMRRRGDEIGVGN